MPLQSLPDRLDTNTHDALDRNINDAVSGTICSPLILPFQYILLLYIVKYSNGNLDPKYTDFAQTKALVDANRELGDMLSSAWEKKSYRDIRNLAILKPQAVLNPAGQTVTESFGRLHQELSVPFKAKYHGAAVDGFYEYLTRNEKLFRTESNPSYYAKFCSIVQSSGTGKSRVMTELSKKEVVVIYMNLRSESDVRSFPLRDPIPSNILTHFPPTVEEYEIVCHAFFTALFDAIEEHLLTGHDTWNPRTGAMRWIQKMSDLGDPARTDFFDKVAEKYEKARSDLLRFAKLRHRRDTKKDSPVLGGDATDPHTADTDIDKAADTLEGLSLTDRSGFSEPLFAAYEKMVASLKNIFVGNSDQPKLVIAADEAHSLTVRRDAYRPADVFCRVVNMYSRRENHPVWVVFTSTTANVADFAPPNQKHNSDRIAIEGEKLFPPYTQLGWDQYAVTLGQIGAEDVSKFNHIAGYGRPLWTSLRSASTDPQSVLRVASTKLCAGEFDAKKTGHVLAVLGQRFELKVALGHPDAVEHLESGVASHLLMCLGTTLDRNWRFTSYPSEPLLSSAAAWVLHALPQTLGVALETLLQSVNSGMIDIGQRGELASRLLLLLAKDLFVRTRGEGKEAIKLPSSWEDHLPDCQMIPVVDWLQFVFGPRVWENTQGSLARETFKDAYLNFSHWVCMEENVAGSKEDDLLLDEWTLRHWQRTSGVQCCHQQTLIDKVIPIYFKGGPESGSPRSRMSQIFVSDRARKSKSSKPALDMIMRRNSEIDNQCSDSESCCSLPYIAILADLGQPSSCSVAFPEGDGDDQCLRIYAAGVETATYPFLVDHPEIMKTLQDLVRLQQMPETETRFMHYLNAQVKVGSTASRAHMEWERGSIVPN